MYTEKKKPLKYHYKLDILFITHKPENKMPKHNYLKHSARNFVRKKKM